MIISICNNKGGVGKTTITANLAHALANKGKKVLVIDNDPQGNTTSIMLGETIEPSVTLRDAYGDGVTPTIYPTQYENVSLIANETATASLEPVLYGDLREAYHLLNDIIKDITGNYDYVLIDSPPNLGLFVIMSLVASDAAIIPLVSSSRFSIEGFVAAYDAIKAVSDNFNPRLKFLRAVINRVDKRTSVSKLSIEHIRQHFGSRVFETTIPHTTDIEAAEQSQLTVIRWKPQSGVSKRFRALAEELIDLIDPVV